MIKLHVALSTTLTMAAMFLCHQGTAVAQNSSVRVLRASPADEAEFITDDDIQVLRKNIRSQRKQMIAANLIMTDVEAEKFWPIYEQYSSEAAKIEDTKYELIKQSVQNRGVLTDVEAEIAVKEWPDIDQSLAQLNMRYIPMFRKILSPKNTALFYQLNRRVQLLIDAQLASAVPLIEPCPSGTDESALRKDRLEREDCPVKKTDLKPNGEGEIR